MAVRQIRVFGDEVLTKKSREVKFMTPRIRELIEDMKETLFEAGGVGLAAPQVGVLKRIVYIDLCDDETAFVMINPNILETSGEQTGEEGCLSLPGKCGKVTRPNFVRAEYQDENMDWWEVEGEGLLARAILHECDHLDGHLYTELVEGQLHDVEELEAAQEESEVEEMPEDVEEEEPEEEREVMHPVFTKRG